MNGRSACVYRDGRRRASARALVAELAACLETAAATRASQTEARRRIAVDALVMAGVLEAALADAGHPSAEPLAAVTDHAASLALGLEPRERAPWLASVDLPDDVQISAPEGFAYDGLHPESYARAVRDLEGPALVVGVRSIGTTLSAISVAALRARGRDATRITVRPTGTTVDRRLYASPAERHAFARARDGGARVLVVDEGPGPSGSTLLAVAEAVLREGVPRERIAILCSHEPDVDALIAPDAANRWRSFRVRVVPADVRVPAGLDVSAGAWRSRVFRDEALWPASWISTERRKWLGDGGTRLVKFEGLGRSGAEARARACALAKAGFALPVRDDGDGLASTPWLVHGKPLSQADVDRALVEHAARYCAARVSLCPAADAEDLTPVAQKNLALAFRAELPGPLVVERPVIADARMMLHEWVRDRDRIWKTDGASHGDDHFFPGPTDVAWDLAGLVVEWRLDGGARRLLLDTYRRASGDDAAGRLGPWLAAYVACRAAWLALAAESLADTSEGARLARALHAHLEEGAGVLASSMSAI